MMKRLLTAAAVCTALALGACATATPYQPLTRGSSTSGGYSEHAIEGNRWQVSFSGNSLTDRKTVERYLLFRSAELTTAQGYDWFEIVDRNTDKKTQVLADPSFNSWGYGGGWWGPSWRLYSRGYWGGWGPSAYWGGWGGRMGGWNNFDYREVSQFEATAEVFMGRGPKPATNTRAFDAREVQSRMGPTIVRPT